MKDILEGNWNQIKGEIKMQWGKLTDDDLTLISGSKDKLLGKLQERYGYDKSHANTELDKFLNEK